MACKKCRDAMRAGYDQGFANGVAHTEKRWLRVIDKQLPWYIKARKLMDKLNPGCNSPGKAGRGKR